MDLLDLLAETDTPAAATDGPPTCGCLRARGSSDGFTNAGTRARPWWVHAACGLPTPGWLASQGAQR